MTITQPHPRTAPRKPLKRQSQEFDLPDLDVMKGKISVAEDSVRAYLVANGWQIMKDFDRRNGTNSQIGDTPITTEGVSGASQEGEFFEDAVGNALGSTTMVGMVVRGGSDIQSVTSALADKRMSFYMDYTIYDGASEGIAVNKSQKNALARVAFDKMVEEIGGKGLLEKVMEKVKETIPAEHPFHKQHGRG